MSEAPAGVSISIPSRRGTPNSRSIHLPNTAALASSTTVVMRMAHRTVRILPKREGSSRQPIYAPERTWATRRSQWGKRMGKPLMFSRNVLRREQSTGAAGICSRLPPQAHKAAIARAASRRSALRRGSGLSPAGSCSVEAVSGMGGVKRSTTRGKTISPTIRRQK